MSVDLPHRVRIDWTHLSLQLHHRLFSGKDLMFRVSEICLVAAVAVAGPAAGQNTASNTGDIVFLKSIVRDDLAKTVSVEISHDGRFAYAASWGANAVTVFERDTETGDLTHRQTISNVNTLNGAVCVRLSDDDRMAVATAFRSHSVLLFARDAESGLLTELDIARDAVDGVSGLNWAIDAAFSPNARFLYVIGSNADAISWFRITRQSGLQFIASSKGEDACFDGARGVCMSPDGGRLYVASANAGALVALDLDPETGDPTIVEIVRNGDEIVGLDGAFSVKCSPDGRFVYTNSGRFGGDNAVCVFENRDGRLHFIEVHRDGENGVEGLVGGNELAITLDGLSLYALGTSAGAIVCFDRNPRNGRLDYLRALVDEKGAVGYLGDVSGIAVSPDNRHVYAAAEANNAISIFERRGAD